MAIILIALAAQACAKGAAELDEQLVDKLVNRLINNLFNPALKPYTNLGNMTVAGGAPGSKSVPTHPPNGLTSFGLPDALYTLAMSAFAFIPIEGMFGHLWTPQRLAPYRLYLKLWVVSSAFVVMIALQTLKGYYLGTIICVINLIFRIWELFLLHTHRKIGIPKFLLHKNLMGQVMAQHP